MHMKASSRSPQGSDLQRGCNQSTEQLTPVLAWPLPSDGRSQVSLALQASCRSLAEQEGWATLLGSCWGGLKRCCWDSSRPRVPQSEPAC